MRVSRGEPAPARAMFEGVKASIREGSTGGVPRPRLSGPLEESLRVPVGSPAVAEGCALVLARCFPVSVVKCSPPVPVSAGCGRCASSMSQRMSPTAPSLARDGPPGPLHARFALYSSPVLRVPSPSLLLRRSALARLREFNSRRPTAAGSRRCLLPQRPPRAFPGGPVEHLVRLLHACDSVA